MKISQLSKATGVSARSIRYYEKKKLIAAKRLENDYREFDETDIKRIKTIQIYLELGMSTKEILEILKCHDDYDAYADKDGFCVEMLDAYEEKRAEIAKQIEALSAVQQRLDGRIEQMKVRQALLSKASDPIGQGAPL
ncbi:MerR family transcriptional regulator [Paenibacillus hamazuiensis]|uniref:MerR family transcriptional regulator n=1 Tax=Paenibacillus hamazuiensis TaxID=2936508 RepID=UPI00200C8611|nr:MerR family transcriptional regulator [Paenibacillus hamazuiensis]